MAEEVTNGIILEKKDLGPERIEPIIFKLMFSRDDLRSTMIPYLSYDLFQYTQSQTLFKTIMKFESQFNSFPTIKDIRLFSQNNEVHEFLDEIVKKNVEEYNEKHLLGSVEHYIRKSMYMNQITKILTDVQDPAFIVDSESDLPEVLRDIFSFSFDNSVGMNVFSKEGIEQMMEFFHQQKKFIKTEIKGLDTMLNGGFHSKSLSLILAPTNQGKSAIMCALGANQVMIGKNVLYITLEMSEEMISQRVMANIFNIDQDGLAMTDRSTLMKKFEEYKDIISDRFRVKNFSSSMASANTFRKLLKEYKTKQGWEPDIIYIDYLGLGKPNRIRKVSSKHEDLQTVSEEYRDIGNDLDIPIVSAMQTNRDGFNSTNIDLDKMASSFGVAMTADFVLAAIMTEELKAANQYLWFCVKNRFGQNGQEFNVGMDFNKMQLTDLGEQPRNKDGAEIIPASRKSTDSLLEEDSSDYPSFNNINSDSSDFQSSYDFD